MVKQGIKHFEGNEGVWYVPETNELWLITEKEFTLTHDGECLRSYHKYKVETREFKPGQKLIITGDSEMIYIGEFGDKP